MPYPDLPCILIVDDDVDQSFLTRRMLEKAQVPYPIVELFSCAAAIQYLTLNRSATDVQAPPALILLDLKMPGLDGLAFLRWKANQPHLHSVKVVMLTTSENPEDIRLCNDLGAHGYLIKHPSAEIFERMLRQTLNESTASNVAHKPL